MLNSKPARKVNGMVRPSSAARRMWEAAVEKGDACGMDFCMAYPNWPSGLCSQHRQQGHCSDQRLRRPAGGMAPKDDMAMIGESEVKTEPTMHHCSNPPSCPAHNRENRANNMTLMVQVLLRARASHTVPPARCRPASGVSMH